MSRGDLDDAVIECGRLCYERRLLSSNDGNISVRLPDGRILITVAGTCKGRLHPDDLVVLDPNGNVYESGGRRPSSESPMHLAVYEARADVRAVIHAHPVFATVLTVAGLEFPTDVLPEAVLSLGKVPVTPYATPSSEEDALVIRPLVGRHSAILLRQHGALTVGADLEEALQRLERMEYVAEVYCRAMALGSVARLDADAMRKLNAARGFQQGS
jgi:L-fuculose-phosphate aldolase